MTEPSRGTGTPAYAPNLSLERAMVTVLAVGAAMVGMARRERRGRVWAMNFIFGVGKVSLVGLKKCCCRKTGCYLCWLGCLANGGMLVVVLMLIFTYLGDCKHIYHFLLFLIRTGTY